MPRQQVGCYAVCGYTVTEQASLRENFSHVYWPVSFSVGRSVWSLLLLLAEGLNSDHYPICNGKLTHGFGRRFDSLDGVDAITQH